MAGIRPLVAGNWKMNGLGSALAELRALQVRLTRGPVIESDIMVCPPATLLSRARDTLGGTPILLGAQDCHPLPSGAHTGDISAEMLADAGALAVIIGHSERRTNHAETDGLVSAKAEAALRAHMTAIICVGETDEQRHRGATLEIVRGQLQGSLPPKARAADTVIAYEPVWAIGTGLTPTPEDVAEVHGLIRAELCGMLGQGDGSRTRILYGGSVKPENAGDLLLIPEVNGALVGGASLKASDFYGILSIYAGTGAS